MKTIRVLRVLSLLGFLLFLAPFYDSCDGNYPFKKIPEDEIIINKSFSEKVYDYVIDEDSFNQLYVKMNATAGLRISKSFSDKFIKEARLEPYYLLHKENSNSGMPFDNGSAMYLNAFVDTKYLGFMLSYWNSQNFIAPRGTAIFQSQSIDKSSYFTPNYKRELLFLRLIYEKPFYNNLYVTARLEPFYDFASTSLDYSYSFYLSYKQNFNFRKAK
jgi:hypothetical protein